MSEMLTWALALVAGGLLGAIFFGGLWWTVRKGLSAAQPALWFFGSLILRTTVVMSGFYFVSGGHWERLLSCFLGFAMASLFAKRLTGPRGEGSRGPGQEASHAPYSR